MKISKEVESLLWSAAESRDPKAMEDFVQRFPNLKGELARRSELVRKMRVAKPEVAAPNFVFVPPAVPVSAWKARWPWGGAALGLAAITFAFVYSNREIGPVNREPSSWRQVEKMEQKAASAAATPLTVRPMESDQPALADKAATQKQEFGRTAAPQSNGANNDDLRRPNGPEDVRIDVSFAELPLDIALKTLSMQSKVDIQVAPPLPEVNVTEDFKSQTVMQILDTLGRKYGFTAFKQEPGHVLVVPATDNERKEAQQGGGDPRGE